MTEIDPFLMQLVIVPFVVIGLGVLASAYFRKIIIAPFVTLLLNAIYETWYFNSYSSASEVSFTSWNIIFPIISFIISYGVVLMLNKTIEE